MITKKLNYEIRVNQALYNKQKFLKKIHQTKMLEGIIISKIIK